MSQLRVPVNVRSVTPEVQVVSILTESNHARTLYLRPGELASDAAARLGIDEEFIEVPEGFKLNR